MNGNEFATKENKFITKNYIEPHLGVFSRLQHLHHLRREIFLVYKNPFTDLEGKKCSPICSKVTPYFF